MRSLLVAWCLAGCTVTHGAEDAGPDADARDTGARDVGVGCVPDPTPEELDRLRAYIIRAYCERYEPCNDPWRWPDSETCERYDVRAHALAEVWMAEGAWEIAGEPHDRVLDTVAVERCADRLSCINHDPFGWPVVDLDPQYCSSSHRRRCDSPPVAPGDPCARDDDCPSDHDCGSRGGCTRTCMPRVPPGSPCAFWQSPVCAGSSEGEVFVCLAETWESVGECRIGRAAGVASEGEACGPLSGDGDTLRMVGCSDGLACVPIEDGGTILPRTCVGLGGIGEPCTRAGCAAGLHCERVGATCVPAMVIAPVPIGAPCFEDGVPSACFWQWGTTCVGGVCVAARGEGQPCQWGPESFHETESAPASYCDATLYCDRDYICRPALELGSACERTACLSGCCHPEEHRCAPRDECWRLGLCV